MLNATNKYGITLIGNRRQFYNSQQTIVARKHECFLGSDGKFHLGRNDELSLDKK